MTDEWVMWWRRSSVPKYSTLIWSKWPELQSIARWHMANKWKSNPMSPKLRMSMVRHRRGSLEIARHTEHTPCARVRISVAPSFWKIVHRTSRGRSSQFRSSAAASFDDDIGLMNGDGHHSPIYRFSHWETANAKLLGWAFGAFCVAKPTLSEFFFIHQDKHVHVMKIFIHY